MKHGELAPRLDVIRAFGRGAGEQSDRVGVPSRFQQLRKLVLKRRIHAAAGNDTVRTRTKRGTNRTARPSHGLAATAGCAAGRATDNSYRTHLRPADAKLGKIR